MVARLFYLLVCYCVCCACFGQDVKTRFVEKRTFNPVTSDLQVIGTDTITAIAIKSDSEGIFKCKINGQLMEIPRDEDADDVTYFISLGIPGTIVDLLVPKAVPFDLYLIKSGPVKHAISGRRTFKDISCFESPTSIPQSAWREGLPSPTYTRSFHEVFHHVVHHSAGSNSNSNYTQVVRDIYLYHTQVNGWSDIGYNYLIAQDGTIYDGRDPGDGSQDHVRGAHFCGSNTGTLGVCLLGNYETTTPDERSLAALENLLTYEFLIHDLSPHESFNHPLGNLATLIGHKHGCATLCPGENVFRLLNEMKLVLETEITTCWTNNALAVNLEDTIVKVHQTVTFTAEGAYDQFEWNLVGAIPPNPSGDSVSVIYSSPGRYDIELIASNSSRTDTLQMTDVLQVSQLTNRPVLYPNPINALEILRVDFKEEVLAINVFNLRGQLVDRMNSGNISTLHYPSGTYVLEIKTASGLFHEKLVVL